MLIVMDRDSTPEDLRRVRQVVEGFGLEARAVTMEDTFGIQISGSREQPDPAAFAALRGVAQVLPGTRPLRRTARSRRPEGTRIVVGGHTVGDGGMTLIAGPCAVEDESQMMAVSELLQRAGVHVLRGGAYKPRTSPFDFQGLGPEALDLLAAASRKTGLPVVTEAVDEASLDQIEACGDIIQIGARNMQNFALLKRVARSRLPVFLKRGMAATLEDLLMAAEYILDGGNPDVMLCERGIRTFSNHSRFTLDLSIVPRLKQLTHLPVFVDPSHATGIRESVAPLARAAIAAGADGVMVEVHPDPECALCDGPQALLPDEFLRLADQLRAIAAVVGKPEAGDGPRAARSSAAGS